MAHRKWKETKLQPVTAEPGNMLGCSLISFHFLWAIHPIRPVHVPYKKTIYEIFDVRESDNCAWTFETHFMLCFWPKKCQKALHIYWLSLIKVSLIKDTGGRQKTGTSWIFQRATLKECRRQEEGIHLQREVEANWIETAWTPNLY